MNRVVPGLVVLTLALCLAACGEATRPPAPASRTPAARIASFPPEQTTENAAVVSDEASLPAEAEVPLTAVESALDADASLVSPVMVEPPAFDSAADLNESPGERLTSLILEQLEVRSRLRTEPDPAVRHALEARERTLIEERRGLYGPLSRREKEQNP